LQQGLVQVVLDEPHAKVAQGALTEGWLLGVETIEHHLPALIHHGEFHRIPIAHVAVGLQQRSEGQHPRFHGRFAARLWRVCLGQRVLQHGIQQLMASLAQKDKEFPGLACARYDLLLFRSQRDRWVPHDGLLKGTGFFAHHQTTLLPLLSTLNDPLSEQLISVLGLAHGRRATDTLLGEEVAHETCEPLGLLFGPLEQIRWYGDMGSFLASWKRTMYFEGVIVFMKVSMS